MALVAIVVQRRGGRWIGRGMFATIRVRVRVRVRMAGMRIVALLAGRQVQRAVAPVQVQKHRQQADVGNRAVQHISIDLPRNHCRACRGSQSRYAGYAGGACPAGTLAHDFPDDPAVYVG